MSSLLPVYYQIKNKIQEWIVTKQYLPGEKIPSENELARIFSVSRLTVRQAIAVLVQVKLEITDEFVYLVERVRLLNNFWFHRTIDCSQWLLHVMDCSSPSGGRGLACGRIYSRSGLLPASSAQEGVLRIGDLV